MPGKPKLMSPAGMSRRYYGSMDPDSDKTACINAAKHYIDYLRRETEALRHIWGDEW
jgi:hypothetical protein